MSSVVKLKSLSLLLDKTRSSDAVFDLDALTFRCDLVLPLVDLE